MEKLPPLVRILRDLEQIASPSGFTKAIIEHLAATVRKSGFHGEITNKGALLVSFHAEPKLIVTGHIDTLGGMVKEIKTDGQIAITPIGGLLLPSFEGGYVSIHTQFGRIFRGTFLLENPAAHVNREAGTLERKVEKMYIRLDAEVKKREDTEKLGIQVGDFVCFDSRFEFNDSGFIKSHFLDDKAGSAAMLDAMTEIGKKKKGEIPVAFFFSNFEEVGHGACAGIPKSVEEMLVVDMGVVGNNVQGEETAVSICVKDSTGPYDYEMRCRLSELARQKKIPHKPDVFPFYGSDGSVALRAGHNLRVGLIGPGVSASHGLERTHIKGLTATRDLIIAYVEDFRTRWSRRKKG